jgi:predicted RNase H-like HicB family nuclease
MMNKIMYTYWKDDNYYIGYLNDYPDYQTQGYSKDELIENIKELLKDIESNEVPYIRTVEELVFS